MAPWGAAAFRRMFGDGNVVATDGNNHVMRDICD
jgi:hypothetical protein